MGFINDGKDLVSREAVRSYAKKIKKDVIAMFLESNSKQFWPWNIL